MQRLTRAGVSLALLAAAAGLAGAQDKVPQNPYQPLKEGAVWHYRSGTNKFSVRVTKHEKAGDKGKEVMCARLELIVDKKPVTFELVGGYDGGLARYAFEGKEAKPPIVYLKPDAKPGDEWEVKSKVAGKELKGKFVVGEEKEVKVPAGTYKDVVTVTGKDLEVSDPKLKLSLTYYFAKDVGMIKQVLKVAGEDIVIELEKYDPPPK